MWGVNRARCACLRQHPAAEPTRGRMSMTTMIYLMDRYFYGGRLSSQQPGVWRHSSASALVK
jgi:hypothetical protein